MRLEGVFELAQALIQCTDARLQQTYRGEDRTWRSQDCDWRVVDRQLTTAFMQTEREWREEDMKQRSLDNARVLWSRFVEKNRRDVEEHAEQLKSVSNNAALIAGFAVVAVLEFQFTWEDVPLVLEALFGVSAAMVVGLNAQAMVTCSLMHASILRSGKEYVGEEAEAEYMQRCQWFIADYARGYCRPPPAPARTFEEHWNTRCEADWKFAFQLYSAGLMAFIVNIAFAVWMKFDRGGSQLTPILCTIVLALSLCGMLQSTKSWAGHLFQSTSSQARMQANRIAAATKPSGLPFDWHRVPSAEPDQETSCSVFVDMESISHSISDTASAVRLSRCSESKTSEARGPSFNTADLPGEPPPARVFSSSSDQPARRYTSGIEPPPPAGSHSYIDADDTAI